MEVENTPYEPISSPHYQKMINFAKLGYSPNIQKWSILLNHSPTAQHTVDLHHCQSSVILVTIFKSYSKHQKTSSILAGAFLC